MKRTLPMMLATLTGFLLLAAAFVPRLAKLSDYATNFFSILAAIAFVLGAGNFLRSHGEKVRRQATGWGYSVIAITAFAVMLIAGLGKILVEPKPGFYAYVGGAQRDVMLAEVNIADSGERSLRIALRKAQVNAEVPVTLGGVSLGTIQTDKSGSGALQLQSPAKPTEPLAAGPAALAAMKAGDTLAVGGLNAVFEAHGRMSGDISAETAVYGYLYLKVFVPLQQMTFALLAFYVASAAFRAFRARNAESILLLGTAFIILLGRTPAGHILTAWLPDEGFGSFFYIPYLSTWIMAFPFTAGGRAIQIGIALGVMAVSLRILLGLDRSYLGSDRGGGA